MSADFKLAVSVLLILLGLSLAGGQDVRRRPIYTSAPPTAFVTDTFTEGSDTNLDAHTGEVGATWTEHPDAGYGEILTVDAATGRIYTVHAPTMFFASGIPPSADYPVCVDVVARSNISANTGPCGRVNTTANTMYCARYDSGTVWQLRRILAGAQITLTSSTNQLISVGNSARLCLVMVGTTISMTVNGTTEGSVTDANITAAGRAGVRFAGVTTATTGYHLDNFSAGP